MVKQHVLVELKQFVKAVSGDCETKIPLSSGSLVRTSLHLLEDLPAARDILFDYFELLYDLAVQSYVKNANIDLQTGLPLQEQSKNAPVTHMLEDESYVAVQEALENLVNKGPLAWAPVIAAWSLHLVGKQSDKNTKLKMSIAAACNYWLNSGAMRGLLSLINVCFRKLTNTEAESCVEALFSTYEKYSSSFEWVVARLAGCLPYKIISQILHCSLKRFIDDSNCRFDSEIGILDYLAFAHESELRSAFRKLLKDGFEPKKTLDASIVPFLLYICNYSEILLQNLVNVFLETYNEGLHAVIVQKVPLWMSNKAFVDMQPTLNNVALRLSTGGVMLLLTVSKLAEQYAWCQDFLEFSLQELEQIILSARLCPIFNDLATEESKHLLWQSCLSSNIFEAQTAVRLLLLVSTQHYRIYYQTISILLRKSYEVQQNGISALVRIICGHSGVVEFPDIRPGLQMVFTDILLQEQFERYHLTVARKRPESLNTFRNLVTLTRLEKKNNLLLLKHQSIMTTLNDCLPKILQILDVIIEKLILKMDADAAARSARKYQGRQNYNNNNNDVINNNEYKSPGKRLKLDSEEMEVDDENRNNLGTQNVNEENVKRNERIALAHAIVDLLNVIEAGSKFNVMRTTEVLKLSSLSVKYFFVSLTEMGIARLTAVNRVFNLLLRQCSARKAARSACLRELVEGALFSYGHLFGQQDDVNVDDFEIPDHEMVIVQNQRQNLGPNANRTILHAGVIGRGLITKCNTTNKDCQCDAEVQSLLLKILDACCMDMEKPNNTEGYSMISLLLVETISTDVMYNGLPFPDEDFTKVTMERDLRIRRSFNTSPILWALLGFIATHRPALCFSSVLLRALCATCLHQWRGRNVNKFQPPNPNEDLVKCTRKLLEVMAMGQLLPPPLSNLHLIIEHFDPPEIALLLRECVWTYLKDHVPSPALFHSDNNGLHWRNANLAKIPLQYVNTLRSLMQKKLPRLGQHYHQMFLMSEMNNSGTTTITTTLEPSVIVEEIL